MRSNCSFEVMNVFDTLFSTEDNEVVIEIFFVLEVFELEHRAHVVAGLNVHQVLDGATFGGLVAFGDLVDLEPVATPFFGEEEHVVVRRRDIDVLDEISIPGGTAACTTASPPVTTSRWIPG